MPINSWGRAPLLPALRPIAEELQERRGPRLHPLRHPHFPGSKVLHRVRSAPENGPGDPRRRFSTRGAPAALLSQEDRTNAPPPATALQPHHLPARRSPGGGGHLVSLAPTAGHHPHGAVPGHCRRPPAGSETGCGNDAEKIRAALLNKDINKWLSCYSSDYRNLGQLENGILELWKNYDIKSVNYRISNVQRLSDSRLRRIFLEHSII